MLIHQNHTLMTRGETAERDQEKKCFPVQLTTRRIDNHTRLIHIRLKLLTTHTTSRNLARIKIYFQGFCDCCCCCLHNKSRSSLYYSVLSNIRTGPTDADAFRGHRLTTQKGYTYQKERKGPRKVNTQAII